MGGHTLKSVSAQTWSGTLLEMATRAGVAGLCGAELKGAGGILTELGGAGWSWAVVE